MNPVSEIIGVKCPAHIIISFKVITTKIYFMASKKLVEPYTTRNQIVTLSKDEIYENHYRKIK